MLPFPLLFSLFSLFIGSCISITASLISSGLDISCLALHILAQNWAISPRTIGMSTCLLLKMEELYMSVSLLANLASFSSEDLSEFIIIKIGRLVTLKDSILQSSISFMSSEMKDLVFSPSLLKPPHFLNLLMNLFRHTCKELLSVSNSLNHSTRVSVDTNVSGGTLYPTSCR